MIKISEIEEEENGIALSELKDKNGNFKYDESSKQFSMTVKMQYDMLKNSIGKIGQEVPIVIWRNRIVDGRNRCKALDELGINTVAAKKLPHQMSQEDRMQLAREIENARRHETPTQIACNAVKEYHRRKKTGLKVKTADILEEFPASSANFTSANWIYKHQPDIFESLFDGDTVVTKDKYRPTQSLAAIMNFYKQKEKKDKERKEKSDMDEELARKEMDNVSIEEDTNIKTNGKSEAYGAIDLVVDPLIEFYINSHKITLHDYLSYKWNQMKRDNENGDNIEKSAPKPASFKRPKKIPLR